MPVDLTKSARATKKREADHISSPMILGCSAVIVVLHLAGGVFLSKALPQSSMRSPSVLFEACVSQSTPSDVYLPFD